VSTSSTTITPTPTSTGPKARRLGLAVGSIALLMLAAACGSGSDSNAGSSGGSGAAVQQGPTSGGVSTVPTSLGTVLTNSQGMTLYGFAADSKGMSNCDAVCLEYWQPAPPGSTAKPPANSDATLGQITGTNGSPQLTVNGWPVYTYSGDNAPGDTAGQGLELSGGLWWVVGKDGSWIKSSSGGTSSGGSSSGYSRGY
jgi:predicted lipoprotein with Yx(FWY)xxD motif